MKIFYHNADLDGKCSAAIAHLEHPEAELIGYNYGDAFPWDSIGAEEDVLMLDVSLPPKEMYKLEDLSNLTWIDHHERAIQDTYTYLHHYAPEVVRIDGIQTPGKAACELTWEYYHYDEPMPEAVRLLGRYDVWDHEDPCVLPFQMGMRTNSNHPQWLGWHAILKARAGGDCIDRFIIAGRTIINYQSQQSKHNLERTGFARNVHGHKAYFSNSTFSATQHYESIADNGYDLFVSYCIMQSGKISISLRGNNPDVDVSEIAAAYGGGGHKGAAGCTVESLAVIYE